MKKNERNRKDEGKVNGRKKKEKRKEKKRKKWRMILTDQIMEREFRRKKRHKR